MHIVFTNHALTRLSERRITEKMVKDAIYYPSVFGPGKEENSIEYKKQLGERELTVIVKPGSKGEMVVVSAWVEPPYAGTKDAKKAYFYRAKKKASFWGKIWLSLRQIIGL